MRTYVKANFITGIFTIDCFYELSQACLASYLGRENSVSLDLLLRGTLSPNS